MKKTMFRYSLMAALVCGLSMSFVACSDDDDDNNSSSEVLADEPTDEAVKAWSWVSVLTDESTQPTDWQNKSYTATIGEQSSNNPTARLIYVSDLNDAKTSFASIAGCKPEELSGKKTVSAGSYGSMTWNISAKGAQNIATVDVNCPLLKSLSQIIYCTEDQASDNASAITGNCYYRLGDVVEDEDGFYWVCVQPSFLGKKNKDSYWVNVFNADPETGKGENTGKTPGIPTKNIYSKYNKKYNDNTILLPTGLKMDRKQNYNFCNLIWALQRPDSYLDYANIEAIGLAGLPSKYHRETFLRMLQENWKDYHIYQKVFNLDEQEMESIKELNFFYYGYHWKVGSTAGVWIYNSKGYQRNYTGCLDDDDTLFEMKMMGYGFDVRRYASDPNQDAKCAAHNTNGMPPAKQFELGAGYWVLRVATGKQLDKNYDPYQKMAAVYDVYVFNTSFEFPYRIGPDVDVPTDQELAENEEDENEVYD